MELRNCRTPKSAEELTSLEREQLYIVGKSFDGQDRAAELRFVDQPLTPEMEDDGIDWDDGNLGAHLLSVWDVYVDGVHRYDLWVHHADSGNLFIAGTTEYIAGRCQSTWFQPDVITPYAEADALDRAMQAVGAW